jgi:hypothetical protein
MKHIKLFEEYSEDAYNRILDLYREKGEDHMTPEEVAYLKSGGETDIPPPRKDLQLMKDPFVLSIGEDFTARHFDPQRPSDKPYTEEETLALQKMEKDRTVSFRTFVFHNYEPIKINDQNKRWINQIWMGSDLYTGEDLTPPGAEELSSATGNPQAPDYENRFHKIINNYFGQYDEGLVYWYFDDDYPNWRDQWNSYIERGGWLNTSEEWAADIGAAVTGSRTPPKPWNIDLETLEIDLQGKKLTMDNIKKEIKLREVLNQLGDWQEGWERLLDRENGYLPTMSWSLFDHLPK